MYYIKNLTILQILIFLLPNYIIAQSIISGGFIDEKSEPVEYLQVIAYSGDSLITGQITDEKGKFSLELATGSYTITADLFGKTVYKKEYTLNKSIDIGLVPIETNVVLEAIVVKGSKRLIERKIDRLVFNVGQSISISGGDALDALKITPRVKVQNDDISMVGKSGMKVLVNDRLIQLSDDDLMNFLKTIKADDIESIEVITNPPAKYEAEGNSGLLNIKLKKARQDSWNSTIRTTYKQGIKPTFSTGGSFNFQKDKLTITSDINYSKGSIAPIETNTIYYPTQLWHEKNNRTDYINSIAGKTGLNYKFSDKFTAGFQYNGSLSKPNIEEKDTITLSDNETLIHDSLIITNAFSDRRKKYNSFSCYFINNIDSAGKVLSVDLDYFNYTRDDDRTFSSNNYTDENIIPNSFYAAQNIGNQKISNYSLNVDMTHPIKNLTLNYGGKLSFTRTKNKVAFYDLITEAPEFIPEQSNEFTYEENTQALYISSNQELNEQWEYQIGARIENTQTKGNSLTIDRTDKNTYLQLFPTAYLSFVPNEDHSFSLNYGRRIDRPSFSWLNPFRWYSSQYSYNEGNPSLKPSFTHNIEFEYTYKYAWTNVIYFSRLQDGYEYVTDVDINTNIQRILAKNFIEANMVGLYEVISLEPYKWLSTNVELDVYYSYAKSNIPTTLSLLDGWNFEGFISNDIILDREKRFLFNMGLSYTSSGVDNLDRNTAYYQVDLAMKFLLLNKNLQVSLSANDIFRSNRPEYIGYSNNVKTKFRNYYDDRYFKISLKYNIGKEMNGISKRDNKNTEEQERTN